MAGMFRPWLAASLALALAAPASAVSISGVAVATTGANTADNKTSTLGSNLFGETGGYLENLSQTSVLSAGGSAADTVGASVTASTRYASMLAVDTGQNEARNRTATSSYTVTFTASAGTGVVYDLVIDTRRTGSVTRIDDTNTSRQGIASVGAVVGQLNAVTNGSLGLGAGPSFNESINSNKDVPFNQTNTLTLTGLTGTQTITLRFDWSSTVNDPTATAVTGNDEIAVRLGLAGTSTGNPVVADDYPGAAYPRTQSNDGHFVSIKAIVTVPEPGTMLLLGAGLAGLIAFARRARC